MKKYIGTKQIEAEPMTLGEACSKGLVKSEIDKKRRMRVKKKDITIGMCICSRDGEPKNCLKNHIEKSRKKLLSVSVML